MHSLTWEQVHGYRLAQHHVTHRLPAERYLDAVDDIGCLQAQVLSAAGLQLAARVDGLTAADVDAAVWQHRTLVKTWAMRGTLHLVSARAFPLVVAALDSSMRHHHEGWQSHYGVSSDDMERIIAHLDTMLTAEGHTRQQIGAAAADHVGLPQVRDIMQSGWGGMLKPIAFRGVLCFGPSVGQNVTFVNPRHWLGEWQPLDGTAAMGELARLYFRMYGPAKLVDFNHWLGISSATSKRAFNQIGDALTEVEVEGWKGFVTTDALPLLEAAVPPPAVRLLPLFDPYTISVPRVGAYQLSDTDRPKVFRKAGWISAVVLVNGVIAGVWDYKMKRGTTTLTIHWFAPPTDEVRAGVAAEVARLAAYWGTPVNVMG